MSSIATTERDSKDEQEIRDVVSKWLAASKSGDTDTVLSLMADDVIFTVPGREPFGKEAFAASSKQMKNVLMESESEILEIEILGDWAWMRTRLKVTLKPSQGEIIRHAGYTLTILRKNANGAWVLFRDANLLTAES